MIISPDDNIQLTIEYFPEVPSPFKLLPFKKDENQMLPDTMNQRRYLLCLAGMRVLQLIKFIRYKYDLDAKIQVNFFYRTELLKEDLTLMDLAYTYSASPVSLYGWILLKVDTFFFLTRICLSPYITSSSSRIKTRATIYVLFRIQNCPWLGCIDSKKGEKLWRTFWSLVIAMLN